MTAPNLQQYRDRAREHQVELELKIKYFTPQKLADRWEISVSSVRDIPRELLPYKEFGAGRILKRRRYHPDDVFAFEATDRFQEKKAS